MILTVLFGIIFQLSLWVPPAVASYVYIDQRELFSKNVFPLRQKIKHFSVSTLVALLGLKTH